MKKYFTRPQKMTIVQGIQSIVLIIDVIQLWLITATMNSYLGGDSAVPVPAAIFSVICLAFNLLLLKFLYRLDRTPRDANEMVQANTDAVSRSNWAQQPGIKR